MLRFALLYLLILHENIFGQGYFLPPIITNPRSDLEPISPKKANLVRDLGCLLPCEVSLKIFAIF